MIIQKAVKICVLAFVMLLSTNTIVIADCDRCQTQTNEVGCDQPVKWAKGNPQEIAPGGTKKIAVKCGTGPYTWSVSGSGFSLAESQTTGFTNELIADATACGVATITVTDDDITTPPAIGYVRSTEGEWVRIESACPEEVKGPRTGSYTVGYNTWAERIVGRYMVRDRVGAVYTSSGQSWDECSKDWVCGECATHCETSSSCDEPVGCEQCIEREPSGNWVKGWPCETYKYQSENGMWHCGARCLCVKHLRLYEWSCP